MRKRGSELLVAVTGSQEPYIYDLPHLLSLPSEFEFRFRYRPSWVEPEVLTQIRADRQAFAGSRLIILFHSQHRSRLLPIRRATIIGIEELGPMIFVRFRVNELTNAALPGSSVRGDVLQCPNPETLHNFASRMLEDEDRAQKRDFSEGLGNGMYLRKARPGSGDEIAWASPDNSSAWASLVEILQKEPSLTGVPMFRLLGFQDRADNLLPAVAVRNRFWRRSKRVQGFELVEHRRYRLRILEWAEPPLRERLPQVRVQCEFNPGVLDLEGASNLVVGRYDALEFAFVARTPGYIELALRAQPTDPDEEVTPASSARATSPLSESQWRWMKWPAILAIRIPLKVSHNKWRLLGTGIIGIAGIWAYLFSDGLARHLGTIAPNSVALPAKQAIQVIGLYLLLLSWGGYVERFIKARSEVLKVQGSNDDQPRPMLV